MLFKDFFCFMAVVMWSKKNMKYVEKAADYFFILDLFSTWNYIPHLE